MEKACLGSQSERRRFTTVGEAWGSWLRDSRSLWWLLADISTEQKTERQQKASQQLAFPSPPSHSADTSEYHHPSSRCVSCLQLIQGMPVDAQRRASLNTLDATSSSQGDNHIVSSLHLAAPTKRASQGQGLLIPCPLLYPSPGPCTWQSCQTFVKRIHFKTFQSL